MDGRRTQPARREGPYKPSKGWCQGPASHAAASRSSSTCPVWLTVVLGPSIVEEAAGGESEKCLEAVSVASFPKEPCCGLSSVCVRWGQKVFNSVTASVC